MSLQELDGLASRLATQDEDLFLGKLFWYGFSNVRIPHAEMVQLMAAAGVQTAPPLMPGDVDVFKRVCTKVKRIKAAFAESGVTESYALHELRDETTVTRRLVVERVDNAGRTLRFDEILDFVFTRATGEVHVVDISDAGTTQMADDIVDEVLDGYEQWRGCLDTYGVREWVRKHVLSLGATQVRPGGGVYFVRMDHGPAIAALEAFAEGLVAGGWGDMEFHSLPLVDDRKQRVMLQKAFEAETAGAIDTSMGKITDILRNNETITVDRFAKFMSDYHEVGGRTVDYQDLLSSSLQDTAVRLDLYQRQLQELQKQVKL